MRIVEGELEQVIEKGKTDPKNEDYLLVRLMDKHAILNPMEKLRTVYPNVLHLEKPGMLIGVEQEMAQAKLARSEIDMFRDFFSEAQDGTNYRKNKIKRSVTLSNNFLSKLSKDQT